MCADKIIVNKRLTEMGLTNEELVKPIVVILYEEGCENAVFDIKLGVIKANCAAVSLCLPTLCESGATGFSKFMLLPARESMADLTESLLGFYSASGAVLVGKSESAIAGMLMGTVRANIPFVFAPHFMEYAYSMHDVLAAKAALEGGKKSLGEIDFLQDVFVSNRCCDMGNVNSLCLFCEGAGFSIKGARSVKTANDKMSMMRESGRIAANRALELRYPKKDVGELSFFSGIRAVLAGGGTAASLIHIIAIARENGLEHIDFKFMQKITTKLSKNNYEISDVSFGELPVEEEKVVGLLKGNIAENAVFLNSDKPPISCKANVFDGEQAARDAILRGGIKNGALIVIKKQGASDNGMPPLDIESAVCAMGLKDVTILTDGRTTELNYCTVISLLDKTPAFDIIISGDVIDIDFKKGKINLDLASKEINARIKKNNDPAPVLRGYLARYIKTVSEPSNGCVLKK